MIAWLKISLLLGLWCESTELHGEKTTCSNIYMYILYSRQKCICEWNREGKKKEKERDDKL